MKVFMFIMAILVVFYGMLHVASVFMTHKGKIVSSTCGVTIFGISLSFILTMLICGF